MQTKNGQVKRASWTSKLALKSFKTRMISLFLIISLVPMVLSAVFYHYDLKQIVTKEVHTKEEAVVLSDVRAIDYSIQRNISFLSETIASNEEIKNRNVPAILAYFKKLEAADKEVEEYVYVDKNDMAYTTQGLKFTVSDRDYAKQAKATKKPVVSDLLVSKSTGNDIIVLFVPILDAQQNYQGGLFCTLSTSNLDVFTSSIHIGVSGYGYLISPTGMLLTHPDKEKVGKKASDVLPAKEAARLTDTVLKQPKGNFEYTDGNGAEREISFDSIPSTGWRLVSSVVDTEMYDSLKTATKVSTLMSIITGVVVAIIALLVSLSMTRPILRIMEAVRKLAQGDLTPRLSIRRKDELGRLSDDLNRMVDTFAQIVGKASATAQQVAAASEQLTATAYSSADIADRIAESTQEVLVAGENQLQGAEQTSTAMGEMADGVQRIAESSSAVTEATQDSLREAQEGSAAVREAVGQMKSIHRSVGKSAEDMKALEAFSQQIGAIVMIIADITSQTQLLSLNASIEAARAGEHGRGFAVVANEVKKLAEQSSSAAADIGSLIQEVQTATSRAAEAMMRGVQDVDRGAELLDSAGEVFDRIAATFQDISNQIQEVSAAAQEMSAGTEEVTASMSEIVTMTEGTYRHTKDISDGSQQQRLAMQEIASSAGHLSGMAQELQEALARFKTK
ncbi:methyl-accepting chemotaxis protein [Paenibacillus lycopersici]|uniref:Methyl-accepting chemotaxis protein n=1 Tax=Paenibacillus lycopersici TaxID=2704462 RepID=A0A6C0G6Y3_9BACL|nr:methyl-accepting chemotaxis protein [Paenibacillus lycopersici]QHT62235.1 methyl-accepting chemotaxis protein [Paenibacillus lycopersici]